MDCYILDSGVLSPSGSGVASGSPALKLAYDNQTVNFAVTDVVYGGTSLAHATVSADADAGAAGTLTLTGSTGTFVDNEPLAVPHATANGALSTNWFLAYDGQSGNFTVGQVVTGGTSNATGTIVADVDAGAAGVLELSGVVGTFQNNEAITDPITGAATVDLVNYKKLSYDAQTVNFIAAQVVYGVTSGAFGTIQADADSGTTGVLSLKTITGTFVDNELLASQYALANGALFQTITYTQAGPAFEVGQVVTGVTSGASGTVLTDAAGALTITGTGSTLFVTGEVLNGVSQPRWVPSPAGNISVTGTGRDQALGAQVVGTPRSGRIKWVPNGVTFSAGTAGITVTQLGQTYNQLREMGAP